MRRANAGRSAGFSQAKVAASKNFYDTAVSQPPIPGTVLLFTSEKLRFDSLGEYESVGNLEEPRGKYLIIDGQHRLAALHFFGRDHAQDAKTMHVPCVIFDGKSEDFATEMFVIINSTPTRINKSHLVDLYERVSWAAPDKRFAARLVERLYTEGDSPLRYKINRLGDRSRQEKWILQAELFSKLYKWALADWRQKRWERRLAPWSELLRSCRAEGFYERYPARGQVEPIARIHRELARAARSEVKARKGAE
jgi:DGQHR domain-containing protein